jgi:hypothetical protein
MRGRKNKVLTSKLRRGAPGEPASAAAGDVTAPPGWWRSVMRGLGSGRRQRALATLQRLTPSDVEDTISEADVQSWLRMLEMESAKSKAGTKPAPAARARPDRR